MAYKRALNSTISGINKAIKENQLAKRISAVDSYNSSIKQNNMKIDNLLKNTTLNVFNDDNYYKKFYKKSIIPEYKSLEMESEESIKKRTGFIKENKLLEKFNHKRVEKRLSAEKQYQLEKAKVLSEYEKAEKENYKKYQEYANKIKISDNDYNKLVDMRKKKYQNDDEYEVMKIFDEYFSKLIPEIKYVKSINFLYNDRKANLSIMFADPETEIDNIKEVKYIKSKNEIREVPYTKSEFELFFEKIVFNTMLCYLSKIWYFFNDKIDQFIVSGYVNRVNQSVGKKEKYYFISAKLDKNEIPFDRLHMLDGKMFFELKNVRYKNPLVDIHKIERFEFNGKKMMEVIDSEIDGFDFENLSKDLLEKNGFEKVTVTQASGDYGADVIAFRDGVKYAIQCKKYSSKVGVKAVQEILAAKTMYKCHVGVVLTNNYFTPSAEKLAESNGILLWDKTKLDDLIKKAGLK